MWNDDIHTYERQGYPICILCANFLVDCLHLPRDFEMTILSPLFKLRGLPERGFVIKEILLLLAFHHLLIALIETSKFRATSLCGPPSRMHIACERSTIPWSWTFIMYWIQAYAIYLYLYNENVHILYALNINIFIVKECAMVSTLLLHAVVWIRVPLESG